MADILQSWGGRRVLVVSPTPTHPQDHGNRKRIFEICSALQNQGAFIHFVHYASEHDWRHARPTHAEQQMRDAWDAYDVIAPTRPLHVGALGTDHTIDEWEDIALSSFVRWLTHAQRFDAIIVNYTWLSFCLEAVPAKLFKILDTHDAFGNRRALLRTLGLEPEFFHTTPAEEAKALARADLVWAIKDAERDYFVRDLHAANCLTMLHAEPAQDIWQNPASPDGFLRAGVIGARNNVNRRNLEDFLAVALPLFHHYMADVKIVIAGGCADDFANFEHPNVEIMGRVPDVASFYAAMDVVIAPIATSTGLKIKVSEALAAGVPLVALAHATEGYPAYHPAHRLGDFNAMALELTRLAFEREQLLPLAAASREAQDRIQREVAGALDATRRQLAARERDHICVVAPLAATDPASLLYDHLVAVISFLRNIHPAALYFTGPVCTPHPEFLESFSHEMRVFAEPGLIASLDAQAPADWSPIELTALFEHLGFPRAYVMGDCIATLHAGTGALKRAYVRHDAITLAGGDADALAEFLRPTVETVLLSADLASIGRWNGLLGIADIVAAPFGHRDPFGYFSAALPSLPTGIVVLGAPGDPLLPVILAFAARLNTKIAVFDPASPAFNHTLAHPDPRNPGPRQALAGAKLLIDLAPPSPAAAILREGAARQGIAIVTPVRGPRAASRALLPRDTTPATLAHLLRVIALLLADGNYRQLSSDLTKLLAAAETADAGWYWLWRDMTNTTAAKPNELETMFGIG